MIDEDEAARVNLNVEGIREYLGSAFNRCELTDKSDGSFGQVFTVTEISGRRHKLKVVAHPPSSKANKDSRSA